jgi:hypothetical protein
MPEGVLTMPSAIPSDDVLKSKYSTIESLIENPICRGYLLKFSESQFNSENINFITAVDHFRDEFFFIDKDMWSTNWRDIDSEVAYDEKNGNLLSDTWNSGVNMMAIETNIDNILHEYVLDHAPHQVCISQQFILKTKKRISLLPLYGPHVFEEAVIDPIKTMSKDVLPRFLQSNDFLAMINNLACCDPLPPASIMKLPPPKKNVLNNNPLEYFTLDRQFTLEQMLIAEVLYHFFRVYLEQFHCAENLLCVRMIDYFEELKGKKLDEEADEFAQDIYRYFVAPGSVYEISTMSKDRKNLMETLAVPKLGMFYKLRSSAYVVLEVNFIQFQGSDEYKELGKIMRTVKQNMVNYAKLDSMNGGCSAVTEILRTGLKSSCKETQSTSVDSKNLRFFTNS